MRQLTALGVVCVTLACCGCDAKSQKAITQEVLRHSYVEDHGPMVVASIIGASAPGGLNGLCMDQSWRLWVGTQLPEFQRVPSMFEMPDPNRPVQITTISRTRHVATGGE